ncbi:hypothetical protein DMH08_24695 [Actinomadura sp. WAC 06369]|nr:hypothetical protein DMH08_24695 [Actinomadura sp. WAC 06369]
MTESPAALLVLPAARRPRAVVWTAGQTSAFLHTIGGRRLYAAYHLIALRGLRRVEAAGLRWVDVDLEHGTAVICQQLQRRNGRLEACPPKTAHSVRVIALDRTTIAALRAPSGAGDHRTSSDGPPP